MKRIIFIGSVLAMFAVWGCNKHGQGENKLYKGLYSFGLEVKSFKECSTGREYWVTDSSKKLELEYSNMNFEKPYEPVYVEVEAFIKRSDQEGIGAEFDSTMVVTKVQKITREIPDDMCN
jgi:copper homeostasis protein (lipoprotein)